jgi:serine/threonine protein kinase
MSSSPSGSKTTPGWQPPTLEEMQAMLPQYQFECLLGRGGMGAVYKALQVSLDRLVAIKVLPSDLIDNEDANFLERFKNEARTMARLNHPSIVNVYDFGETESGLLYFVMEFINGTDVSQMIASQGKLPEDYALSITAHVCDALNYAHKNGVIHRDIKPANILINMDGAVKVADFGLAKQSDAGQSGLTKTNMAMGTPDFVAPEALIPGVPLDGRADLYAIGVMLYQMLTGEIPRGIWTLPGQRMGTDPRFDAIITKAMQTDRDVRYQTAAELRRDLDTILTLPRSALIAQQQAAAEAAAKATRAQKQQEAAPNESQAAAKKKITSSLGPILGLAASIFLVAGLYVMFTGGEKKTQSGSAAPTSSPAADPATPQVAKDAPAPSEPPDMPAAPTPVTTSTGDVSSPPAPLEEGFTPLFKSENDYSGWTGPDGTPPNPTWSFLGGGIACNVPSSGLWSPEEYGDFELRLEWKPAPRGNGAIAYHSGPVEYQDTLRMRLCSPALRPERCGELMNLDLPMAAASVKIEEWNTVRLIVRGSLREHWVNDVKVLEYDVSSPSFQERLQADSARNPNVRPGKAGASGRIVLVNNMGMSYFRNLRIRKLEPAPPGAPPAPPQPATVASTTPAMPAAVPATPSPASPTVAAMGPAADFKSGAVHTYGGHRYQFINEELLWEEAKAKAESMGGHLATITSKQERDWLHQSLSPLKGTCTHVFLGGYRAPEGGPWSWITGEPFDMALWPGNPPKTTTDNHLAYYVGPSGWDDAPPRLKVPFLVEWDWAEFLAAHPQLGKLETGFRSRHDTDAQQPFLAALAALNQSYVANGIARARAAAQAKGSLFEVTMLDAEKTLIEKGEPVPVEDAAETTPALKALRATYRGAFAKIIAERDAKAAPLYDLYLRAIDAYIAELTKAGKTADAVNVQSLRAEIAAQKPAVAAAVAATAATPKTTLTPAPKAPPGGSSWRVAAEYLVNNGGYFIAFKNGITTPPVSKPAEIPTGKFDILELIFDRLNSVLPPAQDADFAALNGLRDLRRAHFRPMQNGLSDAAFAFLANNDELAFLNFEGVNGLTDRVLVHIAPLKKLDYLSIQYAENLTGQGFDKIAGAASITNLELLGSGITDEGLKAISSFKKLQALRISSQKLTAAGYASFSNLKTLVTLNVSGSSFDDESAGILATMPNLASLDFSTTKFSDAGLMKLKSLKKLSSLNLAGTAVTAQAAAEFQKVMPQCRVSR